MKHFLPTYIRKDEDVPGFNCRFKICFHLNALALSSPTSPTCASCLKSRLNGFIADWLEAYTTSWLQAINTLARSADRKMKRFTPSDFCINNKDETVCGLVSG